MDLSLEQRFLIDMMQAGRAWRRVADAAVADFGLTQATALPLLFLDRMVDWPRQAELADALGIERPSAAWLVDQLCEMNLVERQGDPADRRARRIALTERGRQVTKTIQKALADERSRLFQSVDPQDLAAAIRVFEALSEQRRSNGSG
jgi:MarR family transcriptional regulator for hemolysin